eukprot:1187420-Prorocentrum_minimum.AAC.1
MGPAAPAGVGLGGDREGETSRGGVVAHMEPMAARGVREPMATTENRREIKAGTVCAPQDQRAGPA